MLFGGEGGRGLGSCLSRMLFLGGGGGGGEGACLTYQELSHLHFSFKNQEMVRQPITYRQHFSLKSNSYRGSVNVFFSVAVKNEGRFTKGNSLKRRILTPVY